MRQARHRALGAALLALAPLLSAVAQEPAPVAVVKPRQSQTTEEIRLTGTLTAERSARLSPRVDGLVARWRYSGGLDGDTQPFRGLAHALVKAQQPQAGDRRARDKQ